MLFLPFTGIEFVWFGPLALGWGIIFYIHVTGVIVSMVHVAQQEAELSPAEW
jgi:hypothetical protein